MHPEQRLSTGICRLPEFEVVIIMGRTIRGMDRARIGPKEVGEDQDRWRISVVRTARLVSSLEEVQDALRVNPNYRLTAPMRGICVLRGDDTEVRTISVELVQRVEHGNGRTGTELRAVLSLIPAELTMSKKGVTLKGYQFGVREGPARRDIDVFDDYVMSLSPATLEGTWTHERGMRPIHKSARQFSRHHR